MSGRVNPLVERFREAIIAIRDVLGRPARAGRADARVKTAENIVVELVLCCHRRGLLARNSRKGRIHHHAPFPMLNPIVRDHIGGGFSSGDRRVKAGSEPQQEREEGFHVKFVLFTPPSQYWTFYPALGSLLSLVMTMTSPARTFNNPGRWFLDGRSWPFRICIA